MKSKAFFAAVCLAAFAYGDEVPQKAYSRYRFQVDAPKSSTLCMQISEIELYDEAGARIPRSRFDLGFDAAGYGIRTPWPESESPENAVDNDVDTKWLDFRGGLGANPKQRAAVFLEFKFAAPQKLSGYGWYTANDSIDRNPASWRFMASNDGVNWDELDKVAYFGCNSLKALACRRMFADIGRCKVDVNAGLLSGKKEWAEKKLKPALEVLLPMAIELVAGKERANDLHKANVALFPEYAQLSDSEILGACVRHFVAFYCAKGLNPESDGIWIPEALAAWAWYFNLSGEDKISSIKSRAQKDPRFDADGAVGALFLDYVAGKYDQQTIIKLFDACCKGRYSEKLWEQLAGKSMQELNEEYLAYLSGKKLRTMAVVSSDAKDVLEWVDPFIGSAGTGHTTPAATHPFGMVQPGPDTGLNGWAYCSSYQYGDGSIQRFSQTHLSGTGCADFSDMAFMPFVGDIDEAVERKFKDGIIKSREKAKPGYYSVELKSGIKVEITCSEHVAIYRIRFGKEPARLLFDPTWCHGRVVAADIRPMQDSRVSGHVSDKRGWPNHDYYFAWEISAAPTGERVVRRVGENKIPLTVYSFDNLKEDDALYLKFSLSRTSEQGAWNNIKAQIPAWDFDGVLAATQAKWREILSRVSAKGCPENIKLLFTSVYRLCFQPNRLSDHGEEPLYSTFSCWDIYRAAGPLYTVLTPEYVPLFVNSMLWHFDNNGFLPVWTLWGRDNQCMIGAHSVPMIVDAYLKGFGGVDWQKAFDCVKTTLTKSGKRHKANYHLIDKYGYYPCDIIKDESVSRLLEDCVDQACAAKFAKGLGKADDAKFFYDRSLNWTNVFDSATGFMRGKDTKGGWCANFDPYKVSHIGNCEYTEGNAFHWNWHVMHEPELLVRMLGGREKAVARLVNLFNEDSSRSIGAVADVTGLIGQYCHGNEPSHHVIYFFTLLGRRDLVAKYISEVCETQYYITPDGICGNEDCGQMSAWYIFSALGFYPFDPCGGEYVLGESQFDEISVKTGEGKVFRVKSDCAGKPTGAVIMNGRKMNSPVINHKDIVNGGTLRFVK